MMGVTSFVMVASILKGVLVFLCLGSGFVEHGCMV